MYTQNTEPTEEDLASPEFQAVWEAIKKWDIDRGDYSTTESGRYMYAGATGTDVMTILNALKRCKSTASAQS